MKKDEEKRKKIIVIIILLIMIIGVISVATNLLTKAKKDKKTIKVDSNAYIITYDENGGNGLMASTKCTYDKTCVLRKNVFEKTGYTFDHWEYNGKSYEDESEVKNLVTSGTIELKAIYKANTYKINYELNGGVEKNLPTLGTFDETLEILNPSKEVTISIENNVGVNVEKENIKGILKFLGWTSDDIKDTNINWNGSLTTKTDFKNLTNINNEEITLTANYSDTTITLPKVEKLGYTCKYKENDKLYEPLSKYTIKGNETDKTLSVVCNENTYTITYNGVGGTGEMEPTTCTYGNCVLSKNSFEKNGYTFDYWEYNGKSYKDESEIKDLDTNESIELKAIYKPNEYTITYNGNSGIGDMNSITCTYDEECTLNENEFVKDGYTFISWKDVNNNEYKALSKVKNLATSGNVDLNANWSANTYTITYNGNGGNGSTYKTTCTYDTNCTIAANNFIFDNHNFINWKDENDNVYEVGSTVRNLVTSGNIDFYANWKEEETEDDGTINSIMKKQAYENPITDFTVNSKTSGTNGIYSTTNTDSGNIVYYYRGKVDNNLIFNNMCWKIIRTTETGGVKLMYNGLPSDGKCSNTGTDSQIGKSYYSECRNDNACAGYMSGTVGASTYAETHTNTNETRIKKYIDNWFSANFDDTAQEYLEDTVFCNDRNTIAYDENYVGTSNSNIRLNTYGDLGYGKESTLYQAAFRASMFSKQPNPSLVCKNASGLVPENNDSFTVSSENGNGKLTYPVGLITLDEVVFAGFNTQASNSSDYKDTNSYLYTGTHYWTMTPVFFDKVVYIGFVGGDGSNAYLDPYASALGVRPVISLKSGIQISESGTGTEDAPYIVK